MRDAVYFSLEIQISELKVDHDLNEYAFLTQYHGVYYDPKYNNKVILILIDRINLQLVIYTYTWKPLQSPPTPICLKSTFTYTLFDDNLIFSGTSVVEEGRHQSLYVRSVHTQLACITIIKQPY